MNRKQIMSMLGSLPQHELEILKEEYFVDIKDLKIKVENDLKIFEFIMKKYFLFVFVATMCVACNSDFEEVYSQHEKLLVSKNEKKKDPNFLIHNDHYQKGKEETK